MACNLIPTNTPLEQGTNVSDVLETKKMNYKIQNKLVPCHILVDFLRVVFSNLIPGNKIEFAKEFFAQDELESPLRFDPVLYAEAFYAGVPQEPEYANLSEADRLLKVAEAIYFVYGDVPRALIAVAQGLVGLFGGLPLSEENRISIGVALVRLVLLKNIQGLGQLALALREIGFTLDDIPTFLRNRELLEQILSTTDIGKELLPLLIGDIPLLVTLLDNPILWPGFSGEDRKKAILQLLWEDLDLKNMLDVFKDAFEALGFETSETIAEVMKTFLSATVPQTINILQGNTFPIDEITLTMFELCSNPSDSLIVKTNLLLQIFNAMNMPAPTNDQIANAILNINNTTTLLNDLNVFEVIVKTLNQFIADGPDKLNSIAMILQTYGQSASEITSLLSLIGGTSKNIAEILLGLNFSVKTIVQSLMGVNVSNQTIVSILIDLGISAQNIATAFQGLLSLQELFNLLVAITPKIQSNALIDILRNIGASNAEIISLMKISGAFATSVSRGEIGGAITPFDLTLTVSINPTIGAILGNDGTWSVNLSGLGLADGVFVMTLLTSGIILDTANLLLFDGIYVVFDGSATIEEIVKVLEESGFTLEQKVQILLKLGHTFEEIKALLKLTDFAEIGQLIGLIISLDSTLDFEAIIAEIPATDGPEAVGIIIGEALKIMQANGVIQLFNAEQIEGYIRLTKLNRADIPTALSVALKILCIPDVKDICVALKVDPCCKGGLLIQKDLADFVLNDNASFTYEIDKRKAAGSVALHDTIMSYDPQNLIDNKFCEDEFSYTVTNLKGQTGEASVKIQIIFEFNNIAYHV
ncbi:MAG: hypothetical protein H6850_03715 [Alphaproteobacteria bacterium]|nr:MAG: hypothetical protein H6850_03715 [Alphaproteobacteria bacterium]